MHPKEQTAEINRPTGRDREITKLQDCKQGQEPFKNTMIPVYHIRHGKYASHTRQSEGINLGRIHPDRGQQVLS